MPENLSDRERRDVLSRVVMGMLVRRGLSRQLKVVADDDSKPLVFALEDDLLSEVMHRVENAGGSANTFVGFENDTIKLASIRRAGIDGSIGEDLGNDPVHSDITIGMFLAVAEHYEGVTARIRLPRHSGDVASVQDLDLVGQR